ncbi:ArsR family transcriptional regulator [Halorubrum sp. RMP-47]|uniref:DUF7342 family protein n=1 Tax=Halorubrum miltondacostae TaxID=3076378 RepID=UPI00352872FD
MGQDSLASTDAITIDAESDHVEAWKDETDGIDRVISVGLSIDQPRTAQYVADEAHVSESTARKHLDRLVDLHVLGAVEQRGAKTYYPDSAYQHFREVSQVVEEYDQEEIERLTISTKEEIEELKETYELDSPEELRSLATAEETTSEETREYFKKASEWDQHLRMLSVANEALDRYSEFSEQDAGTHHGSA